MDRTKIVVLLLVVLGVVGITMACETPPPPEPTPTPTPTCNQTQGQTQTQTNTQTNNQSQSTNVTVKNKNTNKNNNNNTNINNNNNNVNVNPNITVTVTNPVTNEVTTILTSQQVQNTQQQQGQVATSNAIASTPNVPCPEGYTPCVGSDGKTYYMPVTPKNNTNSTTGMPVTGTPFAGGIVGGITLLTGLVVAAKTGLLARFGL